MSKQWWIRGLWIVTAACAAVIVVRMLHDSVSLGLVVAGGLCFGVATYLRKMG